MRPDVHLPVGTPPPQRRSHLVLGCAHLLAVAGGVTSQLTQIWPLASGLAGFSMGSSEIATVRRGWPSFVTPWFFLPLLPVLGLPMDRYPAEARRATPHTQLDSALPISKTTTQKDELKVKS